MSGSGEEVDANGPDTQPRITLEQTHHARSEPDAYRRLVRHLFMEFAVELEQADTHADVVHVLMRLDGYVNRMLEFPNGP